MKFRHQLRSSVPWWSWLLMTLIGVSGTVRFVWSGSLSAGDVFWGVVSTLCLVGGGAALLLNYSDQRSIRRT